MAAKHIVLTEKNGGMKDLMEKYYNMIYYCAYKILFYFLYRLINHSNQQLNCCDL